MPEWFEHFGYLGIVLFLIGTGAGIPLPEELGIIAAGIFAGNGSLNVWGALASCLIGCLLGDGVMYGIGYHFGHSLLRRHPRFAHFLHAERERQIERVIQRHGLKVFFLARFLVGVRGPMYIAAGTLRIPFRRFLKIDAICATVVVGFFFSLSYFFGNQIEGWLKEIRNVEKAVTVAVIVVLAVALIYYFVHRRLTAKLAAEIESTSPDESNVGSHSSAGSQEKPS